MICGESIGMEQDINTYYKLLELRKKLGEIKEEVEEIKNAELVVEEEECYDKVKLEKNES